LYENLIINKNIIKEQRIIALYEKKNKRIQNNPQKAHKKSIKTILG
jgi:hypothetical protein